MFLKYFYGFMWETRFISQNCTVAIEIHNFYSLFTLMLYPKWKYFRNSRYLVFWIISFSRWPNNKLDFFVNVTSKQLNDFKRHEKIHSLRLSENLFIKQMRMMNILPHERWCPLRNTSSEKGNYTSSVDRFKSTSKKPQRKLHYIRSYC